MQLQGQGALSVNSVRDGERAKGEPAGTAGGAEQAEKDLGGDEGVTPGRMAVVGRDGEHVAKAIKVKAGGHVEGGEGAIVVEVERQVHGVE